MFHKFDNWVPTLWDALGKVCNLIALESREPAEYMGQVYGDKVNTKKEVGIAVSVEITSTTRAAVLKRDEASGLGTVIENRLLTKPGVPAKHHIGRRFFLLLSLERCSIILVLAEIALPDNVTYQSGDYLSVLPSNPAESVRRVINRFGLLPDQHVCIFWQACLSFDSALTL